MFAAQAYLMSELKPVKDSTLQQIFTFRVFSIIAVMLYVIFTDNSLWIFSLYLSRTLFEHLFATFRVTGEFGKQLKLSLIYLLLSIMLSSILLLLVENVSFEHLAITIIAVELLALCAVVILYPQDRIFLKIRNFSYRIITPLVKKAFSTYPNTLFLPILNGYLIIRFFEVLPTDEFNTLSLAAKYAVLALPIFAIVGNSSVQGFQKQIDSEKKFYFHQEIKKLLFILILVLIGITFFNSILDFSKLRIDILILLQMFVLFYIVATHALFTQYLMSLVNNTKEILQINLFRLTVLFFFSYAAKFLYFNIGLVNILTIFICLMAVFSLRTYFIVRVNL